MRNHKCLSEAARGPEKHYCLHTLQLQWAKWELYFGASAYLEDRYSVFPSTLSRAFASKHREQQELQCFITGTWLRYLEMLQPFRSMPQVSEAPAQLQTASVNCPVHKASTEVASTEDHVLHTKQERDCMEKDGEPWELTKDCGTSPGSKAPVSTMVSIPIYLLWRLYSGALSYLQGRCGMYPDMLP